MDAFDIIYYRGEDDSETENKLFEIENRPNKDIDIERIIYMFSKKTGRDRAEENINSDFYFN
jgi:hypothetical protein